MNKKIRCICETGVFVGLAIVLDLTFKMFGFLKMPNGGSISIAMLPIILNGYRNNVKYGVIGGVCYAVINFILDGFFWHIGSIFFDYLFAFSCLGLTGLFKKKANKLSWYIIGIIVVCFIRYMMHGLSGVLFFQEYAAEYFEKDSVGVGFVLLYSFILYNGPWMLGSTILSIIVAIPLHKKIILKN